MGFSTLEEQMEYEEKIGKPAKIQRYRYLAGLADDEEITKENFDPLVFSRVCVESGCNPHMFKAQLFNDDENYWRQD